MSSFIVRAAHGPRTLIRVRRPICKCPIKERHDQIPCPSREQDNFLETVIDQLFPADILPVWVYLSGKELVITSVTYRCKLVWKMYFPQISRYEQMQLPLFPAVHGKHQLYFLDVSPYRFMFFKNGVFYYAVPPLNEAR